MVRMLPLLLFGALALAVPATGHAAGLEGTSWSFMSAEGRSVPPGYIATLSLGRDGGFGGRDDCNGYSGRYRLRGARLRFSSPLMTLVGCDWVGPPPPHILGALRRTRSHRLAGSRLVLLSRSGRVLARLRRMSALEGTWSFRSAQGRAVPSRWEATLRFHGRNRGRVEGRISCNTFSGRFVRRGARLRFSRLASTVMGCEWSGPEPPDVFRALQRTRAHRGGGGRLVLLGRDGRVLARLRRSL